MVVKFFWKQCGSPTDEAEWKGRNGVISLICRRMGAAAPEPRTVERVLKRLVEDVDADVSMRRSGPGRPRTLTEEM